MSETESESVQGRIRKCLWCRRAFEAKQPKQTFHNRKCAQRAWKAKKKDREAIQEDRTARVSPEQLLYQVQRDRDRISVPRLEVVDYLEARAGVLEAEEQLRQWHKRLMDRRARLLKLEEPPLSRHVQLLLGVQALIVPARTTAIGLVSTDGLIGVAIYGTPR